jgi:hypothetical protein
MPEKSGLPSAVRGIAAGDLAGCCARPTLDINTNNNGMARFMTGSA